MVASLLACLPASVLLQVAKLIEKKGRLSLADFARESNRLINLSAAVEPPPPRPSSAVEGGSAEDM